MPSTSLEKASDTQRACTLPRDLDPHPPTLSSGATSDLATASDEKAD